MPANNFFSINKKTIEQRIAALFDTENLEINKSYSGVKIPKYAGMVEFFMRDEKYQEFNIDAGVKDGIALRRYLTKNKINFNERHSECLTFCGGDQFFMEQDDFITFKNLLTHPSTQPTVKSYEGYEVVN